MNKILQLDETKNDPVDILTNITVICHLMTLYALHPCEPLATNINRHIKFILNSSVSESLGEWKGVFKQILSQWEQIADQHKYSVKIKKPQIIAH